MNLTRLIKICLLSFVCICLHTACTKNVPGPKGEPGAPGNTGNMKQVVVGPFTIKSASWSFDGVAWKNNFFVQEITAEVINKGEVRLYMKRGDEWRALPYAVGDVFTQMSVEEGRVQVIRKKIHDGPPSQPEEMMIRLTIFSPAP